MSKLPYLRWFPKDFMGDTNHLTIDEELAYRRMLDVAWVASPDASLPDDDVYLARVTKLGTKRWNRARPAVIAFYEIRGGRLYQKRLSEEQSYATCRSVKQSSNAKARWLKVNETNGAMAMPSQSHGNAIQISDSESKKESPLPSPVSAPSLILEEPKPTSTPAPHSKKTNGGADARGTRLEPSWYPSLESQLVAQNLGLDVQATVLEFRDYWIAVPGPKGRKLNWEATYRNRCREIAARRQSRSTSSSEPVNLEARQKRRLLFHD